MTNLPIQKSQEMGAMNHCKYYPQCGGCIYREQEKEAYRKEKYASFHRTMSHINQKTLEFGEPRFIADGLRRRATLNFSYLKKQFVMGFNEAKSHSIINCEKCLLLTDKLNKNLSNIALLTRSICEEPYSVKKGKKLIRQGVTGGDVSLCDADNGIDVLFEMSFEAELNHRLIISELVSSMDDIIRISWHTPQMKVPETLFEKTRPIINNSGIKVYIPAGTFLQASKEGEQALIELVLKYIGNRTGRIADLFCGVGTFSYPLSQNKKNKILSIDSSVELLDGFKQSINANQITNVSIEAKNLFKYPLDEKELENIDIVVIDPPRAGASAQITKIAQSLNGPQVVVAVSCNPKTFVNDANILIDSGYTLKEITMVDQFIYSPHTELVALFEKETR